MNNKVVIKKYGNRKLYDTELRRYINIQHLFIRTPNTFKVIDYKTNEDITEETLMSALISFFSLNPKEFSHEREDLVNKVSSYVRRNINS